MRRVLAAPESDEGSVVALFGIASLFGFIRVSEVMRAVERDVRGRMAVFFPGEYVDNNYRLLDARDGWNYLAVPITLQEAPRGVRHKPLSPRERGEHLTTRLSDIKLLRTILRSTA